MRNGMNIIGASKILRYANDRHFHVLHTHGYKGDILLGFMPKRIRHMPIVSTVHGWTNVDRFSKLRVYEWVDSLSLRLVEAVCLVNEALLVHPRFRNMSRDKLHVIVNGIPRLDMKSPVPEDEIVAFCRSGFIVVSIGRLSKEKGYDYLIQAFTRLEKESS